VRTWKLFFLIIAVAASSTSAQQESAISLPDIRIWGEDRSAAPDIMDKDIFLSPELEKSRFQEAPGLVGFEKLNPKYAFYRKVTGLRLKGSGSFSGDWTVRAVGGTAIREGWYFNGDTRYVRENIFNRTTDFGSFRGSVAVGTAGRKFGIQFTPTVVYRHSFFESSMAVPAADIYWNVGGLRLTSGMKGTYFEAAGSRSEGYRGDVSAGISPYPNHWVTAEAGLNGLELDGRCREWTTANIGYINTVYRNISFGGRGSFRSSGGRDMGVEIFLSGEIIDTGFFIGAESSNIDPETDTLFRNSRFIKFMNLYEPEECDSFRVRLVRKVPIAELYADVRVSSIDNYIFQIRSGDGYIPVNYDGKTDTVEMCFGLSSGSLRLRYVFTDSPDSPAFLRDRGTFSVSGGLLEIYGKRVSASAGIDYFGETSIWYDREGKNTGTIDSFADVSLELGVDYSRNTEILLGCDNILEQDIFYDSGFPKEDRRFYVIVSYGFSVKENRR